jgi:hypothetical protein
VCWNEAVEAGWGIRFAAAAPGESSLGGIEDVWNSPGVCLPPSVCFFEHQPCAAWAVLEEGVLRVKLARRGTRGWSIVGTLSDGRVDCFRVDLTSTDDALFVAWDQYRGNGEYEIVLAEHRSGFSRVLARLGAGNERWLCPRILATDSGGIYMTWVVLREVMDDRGIVDHFPFAMVGCYENGKVTYLKDDENPQDQRIVADLRDGLLASKTYKGYVGLRRNPQLALSEHGVLWCIWEQRCEEATSATEGSLLGRALGQDGNWSPVFRLCEEGYCYAVPSRFSHGRLPVSFLVFQGKETEVLKTKFQSMERSEMRSADVKRWSRWRCTAIKTEKESRSHRVQVGDEVYHLFWADTHCHSNFSPDAEGEVDELIHFGRDQAGLHAMSVIDNDYYPHKALTEPEWRINQAFSEHFTQPGEFVLFPGYEFTFHSRELDPEFNHRCVIYPRAGGRLVRRIDADGEDVSRLYRSLRGGKAMACPHHCSYRIEDASIDWNVEVCSSWRVCLEETDFTIRQLLRGERFGFIGSSDTHRAVPGLGGALTGIYATALTPEALFDAYRNHRCIATQGARIYIDFRVADLFIGSSGAADPEPKIEAFVEAPQEIELLDLVRDGVVLRQYRPAACSARVRLKERGLVRGDHFYYLRVKLKGDPSMNFEGKAKEGSLDPFTLESRYPHNLARASGVFAWTSPIWVRVGCTE